MMNKKAEGITLSEMIEKGQVIVWAVIAILAIWLLSKFLFK